MLTLKPLNIQLMKESAMGNSAIPAKTISQIKKAELLMLIVYYWKPRPCIEVKYTICYELHRYSNEKGLQEFYRPIVDMGSFLLIVCRARRAFV